jgi:transcriptional regulator with XRE-family HTH domain
MEAQAELRRTIGDNLRRLRISAGLGQGRLAMNARIPAGQPQVSRWENGHGTPSLLMMQRLAAVLGCTVSDLVEGV